MVEFEDGLRMKSSLETAGTERNECEYNYVDLLFETQQPTQHYKTHK